ncbi:MAG: lactate utilization protein [Deltaproteobacteria bacterium]|nr:lactate utilization protein [Deltaproteobacteria bacterium]
MGEPQSSRDLILCRVAAAIGAKEGSPPPPPPASARFAARSTAAPDAEIARMISEVERLSGRGRRVHDREEFAAVLDDLIRSEEIRTASFQSHPLIQRYGIAELMEGRGVRTISPQGDRHDLAECDLGITVADGALPETGSVLLRTTQGQPDLLSLLPRVHLALVAPSAILADLHQAFALAKADRHFVLVSGSSRTADIEKVLTLGVHGPKSFHVWVCD